MAVYPLRPPQKPAGWWVVGTLHFPVAKRPRRLTLWLCKWLLEWQWREEP